MAFAGAVVALLIAGVLYQRLGEARHRREFTPPGGYVDVGGHRVHAVCHGDGRPFVLLESGIAASSAGWSVVQAQVSKQTRVCAYDRAGLGWSDVPSCPRTFDRIVLELESLLQRVADRGPCVLVGHSFGAFVVQAYAMRHPERAIGLVLVDPPTDWLTLTKRRAYLLRRGRRLSRVGAVLAHIGVVRASLALLTGGAPGAPRRAIKVLGPTASGTLERLVGEVRKLPPEVHPIVKSMWCQPKCFHAMADHLMTLERDLAAISAVRPDPNIPVTVISSVSQTAGQIEAQRLLAEQSTHGRHLTATRSGHWIQFDEPELIVSAVMEMVEAYRASSSDGSESSNRSAVS